MIIHNFVSYSKRKRWREELMKLGIERREKSINSQTNNNFSRGVWAFASERVDV